jgi:hypothetical protein
MTLRNLILIIGLSLFLLWYVAFWAYQTQYLAPRKKLGDEITKLSQAIDGGKQNIAAMTQFCSQNIGYYYRSLPRVPNDARSQYGFWLLELLQYSGFEKNSVNDALPTQILSGANYQFTIQCTGTLSQLSYFLFEFYYAPFLHRITTLTLTPIEGNIEKLTFSLTVNALALRPRDVNDPYPAMNQLPIGIAGLEYISRLASNDLTTYNVIADRNLLQTAKGGVDRADYTFLTAILQQGDQTEVWFSVRTDDSLIKAKLGDSINSGSFTGKIVEILDQDIVLERKDGSRWLLTTSDSLHDAFALPPETAKRNE